MMTGNWKRSKNYLTLSDSRNPGHTLEFQFAFEKENLKLLKKDSGGKIEIFGFFRK
jgi:hypothetical protein